MEYAKLVAEYLKIIIWPGVALTFILLFRAKITEAIGRLNSVDVAGLQAGFADRAEEARQETEELTNTAGERAEANTPPEQAPPDDTTEAPPTLVLPVPIPTGAFSRSRQRAYRDPAGSIAMTWDIMEDTLLKAVMARGGRYDPRREGLPFGFLDHQLGAAGMSFEARVTWRDLRALYRTSVQEPDAPTPASAVAFVESCRTFTALALEALAPTDPQPQN